MKHHAIALLTIIAILLSPGATAGELSYDFLQVSLAYTGFEQPAQSDTGIDLDITKSLGKGLLIYGAFGTGSIGTLFGGVETADLLIGVGIGLGYRYALFEWLDLISAAAGYQLDILAGQLPDTLNAFSAGGGMRAKVGRDYEVMLFASQTTIKSRATTSLDLQIDYRLSRKLQLSGGIDINNFASVTLGVRSAF